MFLIVTTNFLGVIPKMKTITIALFLFISPLFAQQTPTASNPLAQLKDQVKQALEKVRASV